MILWKSLTADPDSVYVACVGFGKLLKLLFESLGANPQGFATVNGGSDSRVRQWYRMSKPPKGAFAMLEKYLLIPSEILEQYLVGGHAMPLEYSGRDAWLKRQLDAKEAAAIQDAKLRFAKRSSAMPQDAVIVLREIVYADPSPVGELSAIEIMRLKKICDDQLAVVAKRVVNR